MKQRFWHHYKGSPVKITINVGQTIELADYRETDEGYDNREETIRLKDDGQLTMSVERRARDCDGSLYNENTYIADGTIKYDGIAFPAWEDLSRFNRRQQQVSA